MYFIFLFSSLVIGVVIGYSFKPSVRSDLHAKALRDLKKLRGDK